MAMNGIDISSWQESLNLFNISYDFVMIKATEGNYYVNPACDMHFQEAKSQGKKRAIYHFFDFHIDPIAQADYFVDNCAGYIHDAIFVLDWEGSGVGAVADAKRFLDHVRDRIGYNPAIYMSEWVENHYDWSSVVEDFGLILAKYSDYEIDNNYDMSNAGQPPNCVHWPFYFMWQWTSKGHLNGYAGDLDCDIAYLDGGTWDKYAGVQAAPAPEPVTTTTTEVAPDPTTTTTTNEAPIPPEPDTTTTTSTTEVVEPSPSDTTTTTTEGQFEPPKNSIWSVILEFLKAIANFLGGNRK